MNIYRKYLSLFVVGFIVGFLPSADAFARTEFSILPYDSNRKIECDSLEIKNNQAVCTANTLLFTYDLARILKIEVVNDGIAQHFQNFPQDIINRINELNANKTSVEETNKQTRFDFLPGLAQSLIGNIEKYMSGTSTDNKKSGNFQCSGKIYCSQMSSCAEAKFYLHNCPGTKMDGNNDGVPCEKQWCTH